MRFIRSSIITTITLLLTTRLLPGFAVQDLMTAVIAAVVLGVLNAIIKPILIILTLPITLLSLGLFMFIINAVVLWLCAYLVPGVGIADFPTAIFAAIIISVINTLFDWILGKK